MHTHALIYHACICIPDPGRGGGLAKSYCGSWLITVVATSPDTVTKSQNWYIGKLENVPAYACETYIVVQLNFMYCKAKIP